ncbi:hypothetical protein Y032_0398g730 [Ancylostoma ceylanicum]|nr:hypothetical protein Y032_0398g730 [Ancylostoma ceylanicum]
MRSISNYLISLNLMYYFPMFAAVRLFNPSFSERIQHYHILPRSYQNANKLGPDSFFLSLCKKGDLPPGFPLFVCPLQFLLSTKNDDGYTKLYEDTAAAVAEVNNVRVSSFASLLLGCSNSFATLHFHLQVAMATS